MTAEPTITDDEGYVQRALADCVAQGFSVAIEDPATLDFLADVLAHPRAVATDRKTAATK